MGDAACAGRLAGKQCFVTAAGQGIGRSIAERLAREGADVVGADIRFGHEPAPGVRHVILDVTDDRAVDVAAAQSSSLDVLVNCVGFVASGPLLESRLEDLDRSYSLNVRSMAKMIQAFLPAMIDRQSGSIVNIASVVSSVMAAPNRFAYGTTKAAVIGLTMSVARDYVKQGIRCNSISPGTVDTPSLHERWAVTGDVEAARTAFIARQAMGRLGTAEEVAAAAAYLASDEAAFATGTNLVIDGGMSL